MKSLAFLVICFFISLLSGCSVSVPDGKVAVVIDRGNIQTAPIYGPAEIFEFPIVKKVKIFNILNQINISDSQVEITYKVIDPIKYYSNFGAFPQTVENIIASLWSKLAVKNMDLLKVSMSEFGDSIEIIKLHITNTSTGTSL
jgi:hypothetical protein